MIASLIFGILIGIAAAVAGICGLAIFVMRKGIGI